VPTPFYKHQEVTEKIITCAIKVHRALVVHGRVLVEVKAIDQLQPAHDAQLLTYLKFSGLEVGLILNFNGPTLRQGIRRLAAGTTADL
jgi:hypothetical protein